MMIRWENVRQIYEFKNGFARVENKQGMWNFINQNGELISKKWFEYAEEYKGGVAIVENQYGAKNFLNPKGILISHQWFDEVEKFIDGFCKVSCKGETYVIDRTGRRITKK